MREKRKGREEVEDGKRNDLIKKYKLKYEKAKGKVSDKSSSTVCPITRQR